MTTTFIPGFLLGLSLILAIGAQNAFVLRQGLRREHVFAVCAVCAGSDAVLIAADMAGFGVLVTAAPWLAPMCARVCAPPSSPASPSPGSTRTSISARWCCWIRSPPAMDRHAPHLHWATAGARLLRPLFAKPKAWRVLDAIIGVTMLALAAKLALEN